MKYFKNKVYEVYKKIIVISYIDLEKFLHEF